MKTDNKLEHQFVDSVPSEMNDNTVYVSIKYKTVLHKCCCGCGNNVVTPLKPSQWSLVFDGRSISLYPSISCGAFPCNSHYWIRGNRVVWSTSLTEDQTAAIRERDAIANAAYFGSQTTHMDAAESVAQLAPISVNRKSRLATLLRRLFGK